VDDSAVAGLSPVLARHLEHARAQESPLDRGLLLRNLSLELFDAGAFHLALDCIDDARACYQEATSLRRRARATLFGPGWSGARTAAAGFADCDHSESFILGMLERDDEALELGRRATSEYLRLGADDRALLAATTAAGSARRLGRLTALADLVARGRARAHAKRDTGSEAAWAAVLDEPALSLDELEVRFHRAIADDNPLTVAGCAAALANAWIDHDDLPLARGYARTAVDIYAGLPGDSMRDTEARVRWQLGCLELHCGDAEAAVVTLTDAERSLRTLGLDKESDECAASVVDALTVTLGALVAADYVSMRERARAAQGPRD
jgi:hypothetical protein